MIDSRLPAVSSGCLTDEAYEAIKRMVLSTELPPGAQFSEGQLTARFGLSKTPVREALARLRREEFVECIPRSGYRVATLTLKDVRDLFAMRVLLEGEAVRSASIREYDAQQLRRLEELSHLEWDPGDREQLAQAMTYNTEFHVLLAQGSGNRWLVASLHQVMQHMERVLHIGLSLTTPADLDWRSEHPELLRAVLHGDGDRALKLVESQNRAWQDRMIDILLSSEPILSTNLVPAVPRLEIVGTSAAE